MLRELKGTVLHHLGIESAVSSVVDILEEDAVHRGLYGCPEFLGVHIDDVSLGCRRQAESQQEEGGQLFHMSLF